MKGGRNDTRVCSLQGGEQDPWALRECDSGHQAQAVEVLGSGLLWRNKADVPVRGWVGMDVAKSLWGKRRNCGSKRTFCHTLQACAQAPTHARQQRPLQHHPVPHLSLGAHLLAAGLEQLCAGGGLLLRQTDTRVSGSEAVPCGELGIWPDQRSS